MILKNGYFTVLAVVIAAGSANAADHVDVREPLQAYVKAHETGDASHVRRAFLPDARIMGHVNKQWTVWTVDQYAGRFSGKPAPDEAQRRRSIEILDVSGNAAVAKVVLDYPTVRFTDHMALMKVDGQWKIVNKSFYAEPRQ